MLGVQRIDLKLHEPYQHGLQNTPTASLLRGKTPLTRALKIPLNNLMVRLL